MGDRLQADQLSLALRLWIGLPGYRPCLSDSREKVLCSGGRLVIVDMQNRLSAELAAQLAAIAVRYYIFDTPTEAHQ